MADQRLSTPACRRLPNGRDQTRFTNPCFTEDRDDVTLAPARLGKSLAQSADLRVASNQRSDDPSRTMMHARAPPRSLRQRLRISRLMSSHSGWRLRKKLTVDLLGRFLRLEAKLTLEDVDADPILAQRGRAPTLAGVETHKRAMRYLLQGIEARQSQRGMNGRFDGTELHTVPKQLREHL